MPKAPWKTSNIYESTLGEDYGPDHVIDADGRVVAYISSRFAGKPDDNPAGLIAAAPRLLEALKACVSVWPRGLGISDAWLAMAEFAIAEAERKNAS